MPETELETAESEFESQEQREKYAQLEEILTEVKESGDINLVKLLHRAQKVFGHVDRKVQIRIAEGLDIPLSEVYSVVSFYSLFTTEAKGDKNLEVCMGTACYVKGAEDILQKLEADLNISAGQVTEDNKFSLTTSRCVGACGKAPIVVVNDDLKGGVELDDIPELLEVEG